MCVCVAHVWPLRCPRRIWRRRSAKSCIDNTRTPLAVSEALPCWSASSRCCRKTVCMLARCHADRSNRAFAPKVTRGAANAGLLYLPYVPAVSTLVRAHPVCSRVVRSCARVCVCVGDDDGDAAYDVFSSPARLNPGVSVPVFLRIFYGYTTPRTPDTHNS